MTSKKMQEDQCLVAVAKPRRRQDALHTFFWKSLGTSAWAESFPVSQSLTAASPTACAQHACCAWATRPAAQQLLDSELVKNLKQCSL